eukprot:1822726-Karenia_brevis.AAC.1
MYDLMESYEVSSDATKVNFDDPETVLIIQRRYLEEFPCYKDCTLVLINCLDMGDPYHNRDLRSHKGTHPETMEGVARNMGM